MRHVQETHDPGHRQDRDRGRLHADRRRRGHRLAGRLRTSGKAGAAFDNAAVEDLPDQAQEGQANAAANQASAEEFTSGVLAITQEFLAQLHDFTDCVATNAQAQSDPETRVEEGLDPKDGCERPELDIPDPATAGFGDAEGDEDAEGDGPPSDVPQGPPADAGPPSDRP